MGIGPQIAALDIDMRDAPAVPGNDLVARAHDMLAGAQLDLPRPSETRQQFGDIDSAAGEGADRLGQHNDGLLAHRVEPDRAGRDRAGVAVLHPQDDPLAGARRRQTGIAVGRPGVRVMGAGQRPVARCAGFAKGVESVFDDIVARRPDDMDEELAGKVAEAELRADPATVDRDRTGLVAAALVPIGNHPAIAVEQGQPAGHRRRTVAGPVIRGDEPRVQRAGVAKQGKIGREVERVEIGAAVGEPRLRDAHRIEAQDWCVLGQIRLKLADQPIGLEGGHQHRARPALRQRGDRRGGAPQHRGANARYILDVNAGDLDLRQSENLGEPFRCAIRIDDRDRRLPREPGQQRARRLGRMRVGQRFIQRVPAAEIVEGLDAQRHDHPILHRPLLREACQDQLAQRGAGPRRVVGRRIRPALDRPLNGRVMPAFRIVS